jgi:serine/threonine-protein kinase RsbW
MHFSFSGSCLGEPILRGNPGFQIQALYDTVSELRHRVEIELDTGSNQVLDQYYPSTLESVDRAESEVLQVAAEAGFDEDDQHRIGMAVREGMVNAVVHGNRYNRNKKVRVKVAVERLGVVTKGRFTVSITDQGEGFEMHEIPDPLHDANLLRHSGRGLFLMGAFMDDLKVQKALPSGTEVVLVKNIGPRE